jgi:hypothetical protein
MLPMPPNTAATNALRPGRMPSSVLMEGKATAYSTPPSPARAAPTAKVNEITWSTLMPISRAAGLSKEAARIALPILVRRTRTHHLHQIEANMMIRIYREDEAARRR